MALPATLAASYLFNGNCNDSSGSNDGTPTDITYIGNTDQAAMFYSAGDCGIAVPADASINFDYADDFTIAFWVQCSKDDIWGYASIVDTQSGDIGWFIEIDEDGYVYIEFMNDTDWEGVYGTTDIADNTPHHVIISFTASTKIVTIYIDNVLESVTHDYDGSYDFGVSADLAIGVDFKGIIDQFIIAARVLDSTDRTAAYSDGYWDANEMIEDLTEEASSVDVNDIQLHLALTEEMSSIDADDIQLHLSLSEEANIVDINHIFLNLLLTETSFVYDTVKANWIQSITESVSAVDLAQIQLHLMINEYIFANDVILDNYYGVLSINESMSVTDAVSLVQVFDELLTESIAAEDITTLKLGIILKEWMSIKETVTAGAMFTDTLTESVAAVDSVIFARILSLVESCAVTDLATIVSILNENLTESVSVVDVLTGLCVFTRDLTESMAATDAANFGRIESLTESLSSVDVVTVINHITQNMTESVSSIDVVTGSLSIVFSLTESMIVVDTVTSNGKFYHSISDGVKIDVSVIIDGDVYECFVLNTPKFLPSVYSGFDFNSYAVFNGRAFGANATGIFELTGATDNGSDIHAGVLLHETDFGIRNQKRMRKGYLAVSGDQPIMVMEQEDGSKIAYNVDSKGMVDASREIQGRDWTLSVAEFDELSSIKLIPVILARGK